MKFKVREWAFSILAGKKSKKARFSKFGLYFPQFGPNYGSVRFSENGNFWEKMSFQIRNYLDYGFIFLNWASFCLIKENLSEF